jgi:hypothetical protein
MLFNFALQLCFMVSVFAPLANAGEGIMWDRSGWLFWNFVVTFASWFFFYKSVKTKPGYLDGSHSDIEQWRRCYEETLEAYADEDSAQKMQAHTVRLHKTNPFLYPASFRCTM